MKLKLKVTVQVDIFRCFTKSAEQRNCLPSELNPSLIIKSCVSVDNHFRISNLSGL